MLHGRLLAVLGFVFVAGCVGSEPDASTDTSGADLSGGTAENRWSASGYLASGDLSKAACGATLIAPNVVVTAAHCVKDDTKSFVFGTGNIGSGPTVRVTERHPHPQFHADSQSMIDTTYILRNYDVAYLVLEHAVTGVTPAALPTAEATSDLAVQAIGYDATKRTSTPAAIALQLSLGDDPIIEAHPTGDAALCVAQGDDGSPIVDAAHGALVGIFVGSVTSFATDCVKGMQYLNGYESAFGYRDFLEEGIEAGAQK